jgi:beta-N-acetylglucosaminidase
MGLGASQYALDYAWGKIAAQIIDVYQELVGNRG